MPPALRIAFQVEHIEIVRTYGGLLRVALLALSFITVGYAGASANNYPDKPVRLIIPFGVGGTNTFLANVLGQVLGERWGVQVVTEARPGAGGNLGAEAVVRAIPDGYTLLLGTQGIAINVAYMPKAVDPLTALEPIIWIASGELVLLTKTSLPVKDVGELIAYGKERAGKLNFASLGTGSQSLLAAMLFNNMTGLQAEAVHYNGASQAATDILGQRIDYWITTLGSALPSIQSGQVRALAVSGAHRQSSLPDTPTFREAGFPEYRAAAWYALFAPIGTPRPLINQLNADFNQALSQEALKKRFESVAMAPVGGTIDDLTKHLKDEIGRWSVVIKKIGTTKQ